MPVTSKKPVTTARSRRTHRKVRTGCANCKRRKIKCDEERPECTNCIKHAISCDFASASHPSAAASSTSPASATSAPYPLRHDDHPSLPTPGYDAIPPPPPPASTTATTTSTTTTPAAQFDTPPQRHSYDVTLPSLHTIYPTAVHTPSYFVDSTSSSTTATNPSDRRPDTTITTTSISIPPSPADPLPLNVTHLHLLHHYTTCTVHTMSPHPILRQLWSTSIPAIAFEHPFLLRGVLGLSALHLTHLCRGAGQLAKAGEYHGIALHEYSVALRAATGLLATIGRGPPGCPEADRNATPVYVFSSITVGFAWGSGRLEMPSPHAPRRKDGHGDDVGADDISALIATPDGRMADWLSLVRGSRSVIEMCMGTLEKGPMGPLFRIGGAKARRGEIETERLTREEAGVSGVGGWVPAFRALRRMLAELGGNDDPGVRGVYDEAVTRLEQSYGATELDYWNSRGLSVPSDARALEADPSFLPETSMIFTWLFRVSDEYLALLARREPVAVVVLAYFCPLLCRMDEYWWMKGWGRTLCRACWVLLGEHEHAEDWRLWMGWAVRECGGGFDI